MSDFGSGEGRLSELQDLVDALKPVVDVLNEIAAPHYVGGSVASSFHGATRSTMDVDIVCVLSDVAVPVLVSRLSDRFYISESAVRDAVRRRSCFNLIFYANSFKVDVFVSRGRPFDIQSMQRARPHRLGDSPGVDVPIATAEDVIISKLEWYRLTNETSQRQWEDVSRLKELLGDEIDRSYLQTAAQSVGVADLLEKLMK